MQKKVEKFIEEEKLLKTGSKVIIGVSGGADSIALLNVLHDAGYETIAAHCNFHLREEESVRDEMFVKKLCEERSITYRSTHFDTIKYAAQYSLSIEMAARELRYNWFEKLRQEFDADAIAVGHHKDDSIETVLMNMVRGTGIRGLTGIKAKFGYIIRPFLCVTRSEIEDYMNSSGFSHVDDRTNSESIYTRNIIRLDVMPYLERINPSARQSIYKTIQTLKQVENVYLKYVDDAKKDVLSDDKIDISKLKEKVEPKAVLFELIYEYGFNSSDADDIYDSLDKQSGKTFYSKSHKIIKDRNFLLIAKEEAKKKSFKLDKEMDRLEEPFAASISYLEIDDKFSLIKDSKILYLDLDKLSFPLTLRTWQEGDSFYPLGMRGKKKVSDFFSDNKFSLIDKENTWILCSGKDIVWIVGHRPDNRYKIAPETRNVLKIALD